MSNVQTVTPLLPPFSIVRYIHNQWPDQVLRSAMELNVFGTLAGSPKTAPELAQLLNLDTHGLTLILDALTGMDILTRDKDKQYALTEAASTYLVPESEFYMGDYFREREFIDQSWRNLTTALKSGKSALTLNRAEEAETYFPEIARMIFPMNYAAAQATAEALDIRSSRKGARVLDVAAGSGVWSIAMARQNPNIQVDALDFPATLAVARDFVKRYNLENQYHYMESTWQEARLPDNTYDIILLGHICHSEGWQETEKMLQTMFRALKPGGRLVIAEFMLDEAKTGPMHPLLFAINMYVLTEQGCVFSDTELASLLEQYGYIDPVRLNLPYYGNESPVMVANKPFS